MKFGIVGTNFVSDFFMDGVKQASECEVVAVCNHHIEKAEAFAQKYGIPHYFASYEDMLAANLIDAVYVAVPNGTHHDITNYFLAHHIPTFCEKPLGGNVAEVEDMIACAKAHQTYLQEGLVPLFHPNFKIAKQHLAKVGNIRQVTLNFSKYSSRYDAYLRGENPTTFRKELANGATMDLGVYVLADCIGLFGLPNKIMASATLLDTGADVAGSSILSYDGFDVMLSYSKASDTASICEICGEKGQLFIDQPSQPQSIIFKDRISGKTEELGIKPMENFYYEITEMIECVKDGKIESDSVPFELSLHIHQVLTEIRNQAGIVFPIDEK